MTKRPEWSAGARFAVGAIAGASLGLIGTSRVDVSAFLLVPFCGLVFGLLAVALGKALLGSLLP